MRVPKASGEGPRPRLGCGSRACDAYGKQRRGDPKWLRFKARAAPGRRERQGAAAAGLALRCGPAPPTGGYRAPRMRARPPGDARAAASAASGSARATAARGAAGSRKIWKMEEAEPAGGGGREGGAGGSGRRREDTALAAGSSAAGPGSGAPAPRRPRRPWLVVGNRGHAWQGGGMPPTPTQACRGQPRPRTSPPRGAHVPAARLAL